jgi:uncharacterized protein involved in exopolysaccharide biosynthesis
VDDHPRVTAAATRLRSVDGNGANGTRDQPVEAAPAPRRWMTRPIQIIVTCAVDAALIGAVLVLARGPRYAAETLVEVRPDAPVLDGATNTSTDDADRFLQTEILAIQSDFGIAGQDRDGSLTVTQVGTTDVLSIETSAGDAATAVRLAGEVTDRYVAERRAHQAERVDQVSQEVTGQLTDVSAQLDQLAAAPPEDASASARRSALSAEYQRLVSTQHQLDLIDLQSAPVTVISAAADSGASRTDHPLKTAALAGVLGIVVAVAGIVLWRRRTADRDGTAG